MSLGSQFLKRLNEGKEAKPTGSSFDTGTEAAKRKIMTAGGQEKNYGDKIAELLNMCGVPGMYIKKQNVIDSIVTSGKDLTTNGRGPMFLRLHAAVKAARGMTMEARNKDLVGNQFQQMFEEVLVSLGAPVDLVGSSAKSGVKTAMRSILTDMASNTDVVRALRAYATKAGIKVADDVTGSTKGRVVESGTTGTVPTQAPNAPQKVEAGVIGFVEAAKKLCMSLGIPEQTLSLPGVKSHMKTSALKDQANNVAKKLMIRLTSELGKRD